MITFPPDSLDPHAQPGRRLARGSTRGDQLLALFGFLAHAVLFTAVGMTVDRLLGDDGFSLEMALYGTSLSLLVLRGAQVGVTTTVESVHAIREAWFS